MSLPRSFHFIRHGETDWNRIGRLQGHTDIPLNENGVAQAHSAAERLVGRRIDLIVTSPLSRAHETASIIAARLGDVPIRIDADLKERGYGVFEGVTRADIPDEFKHGPKGPRHTKVAEGAESFDAVYSRSFNAVARWLNDHPGKNVLFVSHGGIFGTLHYGLKNRYTGSANAAPYHFRKRGRGWECAPV